MSFYTDEFSERAGYDQYSMGSVGSNAFLDRIDNRTKEAVDERALALAEALQYRNPEWTNNIDKWNKYLDCYEAKDISKYVFRHTRESEDIFSVRVQRSYYYNYVASVVDLFVSYLFHSPVERIPGNFPPEDLKKFYEDANMSGDTFRIFIQMAAVFAQVNGHVGILIDMPKLPEFGFESEEARKEANFRPYTTLIQANQIVDWELDQHEKFEWVKLQIRRPQDRDWKTTVDEDVEHYLIWTKENWSEYEVNGDQANLVAEGENPLGEVPLVIIRNERCLSHEWMGLSSVRDIADINIAILNWSSLGDEEIYERCLNVLAMEKSEGDAPVTLSHHNTLEYETGAQPPFYLTPGTSPLMQIGEWIERAKDEIYRLAKLGGSSGLASMREATSGIAYAFEFNETNQSLARKAESLEQGELEIHRLLAKWLGVDWDGSIAYAREFGVEDFLHEFTLLGEARATLKSETAVRQLEEKISAKLFSRESQELRDTIAKEISTAVDVLNPVFDPNNLEPKPGKNRKTGR